MGSDTNNNFTLQGAFESMLITGESALMAGKITSKQDEQLVINGDIQAQRALSCILVPESGDLVLYWLQDGLQGTAEETSPKAWIISVLSSNATEVQGKAKEIALPNNQDLKINANNVVVNAADSIKLNAVKEININVALGKLNECARSMCQMVQGSMVQLTKHFISKSQYLDFNAQKLLKSHASQQLITAEKDIKMDADRINMG